MAKYELGIQETLRYTRYLVVETDDSLSSSEFDSIINKAERKSDTVSDFEINLENLDKRIKVVEYCDNDLNSPDATDIEVNELTEK